MSTTIIA
ncbi:b844d2a4-ffb1-4d9c-8d97-67d7b9d1b34a [Thermothielavioides terrestris]|nr:b844d2a4-ffb1-4d9c-8d97-67d7b9d1b34a [Thermothielavioides terrestris]